EHLNNLNRILTRMEYTRGTFSGMKTLIAVADALITGHRCSYEGRTPDSTRLEKVVNWGPLLKLTDVWAFLGTVGSAESSLITSRKRRNHWYA
ncbi:hypothetical protein F5051DRAFT_341464, partial [Lentinula edodes]